VLFLCCVFNGPLFEGPALGSARSGGQLSPSLSCALFSPHKERWMESSDACFPSFFPPLCEGLPERPWHPLELQNPPWTACFFSDGRNTPFANASSPSLSRGILYVLPRAHPHAPSSIPSPDPALSRTAFPFSPVSTCLLDHPLGLPRPLFFFSPSTGLELSFP